MDILILAIGKIKKGSIQDLCHHYTKQYQGSLACHEIEIKTFSNDQDKKTKESQAILENLNTQDVLILLDEHGKNTSTKSLSATIIRYQENGLKRLVFAIGGADGHDLSLKNRANHTISFGSATWPHMLVRVMLYEQLYRAQKIQHGHPYHRA